MSASAALDAYVAASGKAWKTFLDYRSLRATEQEVGLANKAEMNALATLRLAIDAFEDGMQAATPTPPKPEWTDGDVVLVWNDHKRKGAPIVVSRHDDKWTNHRGHEWDEASVEDAIASRGDQHFRSAEVLRHQAVTS